jgi:hypothetical protein
MIFWVAMYRMRSLKALIDYHELENDEIYFAGFEDLNDPMEGFLDYYWKGDDILWINFFKNYILCLDHVITLAHLITEKDNPLSEHDIQVFKYIGINWMVKWNSNIPTGRKKAAGFWGILMITLITGLRERR